ncbi:MAG: carbamoyltransferase HypF [Chlamydiae bacterium]|nr:carbamoyltransferase HypF [Chlamydiota bacterium]
MLQIEPDYKRLLITISGSVQGVGFRPFVYRLANQHRLSGHIRNTNMGVDIDVQGDIVELVNFQNNLVATKPTRAVISEITIVDAPLHECKSFEIATSKSQSDTTLALLPDSAICQLCLQELSDPRSRRYRYPFLHCMTCGPRFSLFLRMPFDRENTTMTDFSMCDLCQKEYTNPADRRFYSQTNCCPTCGPELRMLDPQKKLLSGQQEAITIAIEYLRQGKIVAVKNTGGFLLLVDGTNEGAVQRLRLLKRRAKKPFALLVPDLSYAKQIAHICPTAEQVLTSPAAPIVLLKKLHLPDEIAPCVTFESPYYGVMLAHNALQVLLLSALKGPLVATSGNISGRPLCITEQEAFAQLSDVADAFLVHNRRIMHRLDDSVVQIIAGDPMILRRARGYIPYVAALPEHLPPSTCLLATGGHLKNSFALAKDRRVYLSQYMGNLDSKDACEAYDQEVTSWETLLNMTPSAGVCDKHLEFYTSRYLQRRKIVAVAIQHHQAHVYSGMLDNQMAPPLLGFSWDGTGLGDDHTIWGAESFVVTEGGMERFASLYPFRLPGAEKAIKEPRRSALGVLHAIFGSKMPPIYQTWIKEAFTDEEFNILSATMSRGINAPVCSSMGRLFDAVSALLNCCFISQFEGDAALALEALASKAKNESPRYTINLLKENGLWLIDWQGMIQQILQDKINGIALAEIAFAFHHALAAVMVKLAQRACLENVLLTGGVMQNKLLAEMAIIQLRQSGFTPFWHHQIPPGDEGLAAGQIMGSLYKIRRQERCV